MRARRGARDVATTVLARVAEEGAYASLALDAEISSARLEPRDAALATEIVYGTLRVLPALDAVVAKHVARADRAIEPLARAALRAGTYQILHLSRVPPYAAVDETVSIVREARGPKLAGFVNAVLRKIAGERPDEPEPPRALVVPDWLAARLADSLGPERAEIFLAARPPPPPLGLRVTLERASPDEVARAIEEARPEADVRRGTLSPRALLVRGAGDPRSLPGYREGLFTVQEEGSQLVALLAGATAGERILDACAGRGGKTTLFAALVASAGEGKVVAVDLYEDKLARISGEAQRLGLDASRIETHAIDLTVGSGGIAERSFDRVVVDAPCTGAGTIHRRPEIALRLTPDAPARMAELQSAIVTRAARWVRPGGVLVYAVCSPFHEEGIAVIERVERATPSLVRVREGFSGLPEPTLDADAVMRIGPWIGANDVDSYQIVRWRDGSSGRP